MEKIQIEQGVSYSNQLELNPAENQTEYIPTQYERATWRLMQINPNYPGVLSREARTAFERELVMVDESSITNVPSYSLPRVEAGQLGSSRFLQVISRFSKLII